MKKLLVISAVAGLLSACGSTQYKADAYANPYAAANMKSAIEQAPEWMSKLPKSANAVYESATATSGDFAMADMKAKAIAYAKICTAAGGKVRSQTKVFTQDNGTSTTEMSEMAIRSICPDIDITGVETVEMKHVSEGNRIRTYVLVALPFGSANIMKSSKETARSSKEAFQELDEITGNKPVTDNTLAPQKGDSVGVVNTDGTKSTLNLLPVDNEAYKQKRAEALQKPGAVVGQVTINN
jgi:hydrogenase maturation factor